MAEHNHLGKLGEDAAAAYLQQAGHVLLARNYRYRRAEIDLVTRDGKAVVFVEVKTRSSNSYGLPEETISRQKISLVQLAAEEYLYKNKLECPIRFDVVAVENNNGELKITHIKDAFFNVQDNNTYN